MVNIVSIIAISSSNRIYRFSSVTEYENWLIAGYDLHDDQNKIIKLIKTVFDPGEQAMEEKYNLPKGTLKGIYHMLCTRDRIEACMNDPDFIKILASEHETSLIINLKLNERTSSTEGPEYHITTLVSVRSEPNKISVHKILKE